jgi:hypothetical protein
MKNTHAFETSEPIRQPSPTLRKLIRPVGRKQSKDPMKLFPYLFQFASTRLSESSPTGTVREASHYPSSIRCSVFLPFRSPSDQLCVVALRSWGAEVLPSRR